MKYVDELADMFMDAQYMTDLSIEKGLSHDNQCSTTRSNNDRGQIFKEEYTKHDFRGLNQFNGRDVSIHRQGSGRNKEVYDEEDGVLSE